MHTNAPMVVVKMLLKQNQEFFQFMLGWDIRFKIAVAAFDFFCIRCSCFNVI